MPLASQPCRSQADRGGQKEVAHVHINGYSKKNRPERRALTSPPPPKRAASRQQLASEQRGQRAVQQQPAQRRRSRRGRRRQHRARQPRAARQQAATEQRGQRVAFQRPAECGGERKKGASARKGLPTLCEGYRWRCGGQWWVGRRRGRRMRRARTAGGRAGRWRARAVPHTWRIRGRATSRYRALTSLRIVGCDWSRGVLTCCDAANGMSSKGSDPCAGPARVGYDPSIIPIGAGFRCLCFSWSRDRLRRPPPGGRPRGGGATMGAPPPSVSRPPGRCRLILLLLALPPPHPFPAPPLNACPF